MNIVAKTDLTFQNFTFNPIVEDGQVWLTSTEIAHVLGYSRTDNVSKLYARNADEFTDSMTMTVNMTFNGINNSLRNKSVRVYSLRGAHLIAMFSNTPVAKEFRKWVLDILDREVTGSNLDEHLLLGNLKAASRNSTRVLEIWKENLSPAIMRLNNDMWHELHELLISINGPVYGALLHMESNNKKKGEMH
ncbi:Bro-N domain-containing protein [Providencia alcalifaciens]|uniref:BRO-N domain-containing protein n=1 Tax=Providencia alcalifaciens TaxID=126385 RepID=UPI000D3ADCB8|nr:BRO family protein [Providencia alcalifaciens]